MAQKESKLNLEMAAQQRRLAHASKRDSTAMKTLSLLGAVFLPGTFLSSVFSMTFFDFNVGKWMQTFPSRHLPFSSHSSPCLRRLTVLDLLSILSILLHTGSADQETGPEYGPDVDTSGKGADVSEYLWIYFVVTIPLTVLIVGSWYYLDRRRERQYAAEDIEIEAGIKHLEKDILAVLRKKTMDKASTWKSNPTFSLIGGGSGGTAAAAATASNGNAAANGTATGFPNPAGSFRGVKVG